MIVGTALQRCARGDWEDSQHDWANHMSWLSVYNKLDYVRLHAASLHVFALWVRLILLLWMAAYGTAVADRTLHLQRDALLLTASMSLRVRTASGS